MPTTLLPSDLLGGRDAVGSASAKHFTTRAITWAVDQLLTRDVVVSALARDLQVGWRTLWKAIEGPLEQRLKELADQASVEALGLDDSPARCAPSGRYPQRLASLRAPQESDDHRGGGPHQTEERQGRENPAVREAPGCPGRALRSGRRGMVGLEGPRLHEQDPHRCHRPLPRLHRRHLSDPERSGHGRRHLPCDEAGQPGPRRSACAESSKTRWGAGDTPKTPCIGPGDSSSPAPTTSPRRWRPSWMPSSKKATRTGR